MHKLWDDINEKKTQKAIENVFKRYRMYVLKINEEYSPKITASYTLELPNRKKLPYSTVENAVVKKIDMEIEAYNFFNWFNQGLKKLLPEERELIALTYLEEEPLFIYQIATKLNVSERKYYRMRKQALFKLAIALRIEERQ